MNVYEKNLGRTAISCGGEHNNSHIYKKGCIVYKIVKEEIKSFISKKDVPEGIDYNNNNYWQPISLTIIYN